ncbi:glycosyltransferase [Rivularia sp. PCC 7116]|uniref:glycosyltransferase family 4 protein n=1 Tax=Rivularia sp. PCC 7116 TaxID=373994 RepID=UPI00029EE802|nr:glycosyltransferase family 4 protein [Rivularia sp. PCC 7116]AFY54588.1 glycosyltransferase [Rivularia sp. PCC 7116]
MFNFGFIVEQALGHITHYQNLKYWVDKDSNIKPNWMPVGTKTNDIWEKFPVIRNNWSLQVSLRARRAINAAMKSQKPDALFLHTQTLALFSIPFMHRIPTIISTDATPLNLDSIATGYNHKVGSNYLLERGKYQWNKSTYSAATGIVTWCEWAKNSLIYDYDISPEKIIVIPPGVDLEQWNFRREKSLEDSNANPLKLLFVGGDFARKGGYTLLEAFLDGLDKDYTLDIVTKDTSLQRELTGIDSLKLHCDLTPNSQRLKQLYQQADIFVFPTEADCLPSAISEAMAAGLPIITTNVGAIAEQVQHGINGLIVPPSDATALAIALKTLRNNPAKITEMAVASRRLAEKRFDARRNYGEILNLMKTISEKSSSQYKAENLFHA